MALRGPALLPIGGVFTNGRLASGLSSRFGDRCTVQHCPEQIKFSQGQILASILKSRVRSQSPMNGGIIHGFAAHRFLKFDSLNSSIGPRAQFSSNFDRSFGGFKPGEPGCFCIGK